MPSAGPPQDCVSADDKQTSHLRVASLADPTELLPPSGRELSRNKANPSREVSSGSKLGGVVTEAEMREAVTGPMPELLRGDD